MDSLTVKAAAGPGDAGDSLQVHASLRGCAPNSDESFPFVLQPGTGGVNPVEWGGRNREEIEGRLLINGAILFRNFALNSLSAFRAFVTAVSSEPLSYHERSSPRTEVMKGVYTSTDYPPGETIQFHNEQSYTQSWPMKLWFFCARPAAQGGATPIADCRRVLEGISPEVREKFLERKVSYVRNYGNDLGLDWQTAFQTGERSEVESYCRSRSIEFEWLGGERLRTRQLFDAVVRHPRTGQAVWFEHTAFFHVSSLSPLVREMMLEEFGEDGLPSNTYYGDGSAIEDFALQEIREAYRRLAVRFSWQSGDLLLIDNMLTAHAREPFVGERKIVVAMTDLFERRSLE